MKKLLVGFIFVASTSVSAGICDSLGNYAEVVMKSHQYGVPIQTSKDIIEDGRYTEKETHSVLDSIIDWAYAEKVEKGDDAKAKTILNFKFEAYRTCKEFYNDK